MIRFFKRTAIFLTAVLMALGAFGCNGQKAEEDKRNLSAAEFSVSNLTGTDAVGRKISPVSTKRKEKYVGIFYSFWLGQHPSLQRSINDIQKILDSGQTFKLTDASDSGQFYFWGEPLYGYYNMQDPWVLTRHMELLTNAGIDFICVDATNEHDYLEVGTKLLNILRKFADQGFEVPKVCFYTNTSSGTTVKKIYQDYYATHNEWIDLWFAPGGKPLIVGITEKNGFASDQTAFLGSRDFVSSELQRYFEVKESQWPNTKVNNDIAMPWMTWEYPQYIHNGFISVPVAQHSHTQTFVSSKSPECSRGYDNVNKRVAGDWREGLSFQQMWDTVHNNRDDVNVVLVTGWNEWIAGKSETGQFVDVYNWEFSRDIEMMKGGYGDNFYLQLAKNIREFKYDGEKSYVFPEKTIDVNGDFAAEFEKVYAQYKDFAGDALARNFKNAAGTDVYTDDSNRNDITDIKVAHDKRNYYFLVQTKEDITAYNGTDENWMNLFIGNENGEAGFYEYNYVINRHPEENRTSLEHYENGSWKNAGYIDYKINGNSIVFVVPMDFVGKSADKTKIRFKACDNVTDTVDIMDYYVTGDCAPLGRLGYSYGN